MTLTELMDSNINKKYSLNTPKYIVARFDRLINNYKLNPNQRKLLSEMKAIMIGVYPSEESLRNSIKGIARKASLLKEERGDLIDKLLRALVITFAAISTSAAIIGADQITNGKVLTKPIEGKVNASKYIAKNIIAVNVDEKVWEEIEDTLGKIEGSLSKDGNFEKAITSVKTDLAKNNVSFKKQSEDKSLANTKAINYHTSSKEIVMNYDYFEARYRDIARDVDSLEKASGIILREFEDTLRHEMTHREQFRKVSNIVKTFLMSRYSRDSEGYSRQLLEVVAFHNQLEFGLKKYPTDMSSIIDIDTSRPQILRNILEIYPDSDIVSATIKAKAENANKLNSTVNMSKKQAERTKELVKALTENKKAIQVVLADIKSIKND